MLLVLRGSCWYLMTIVHGIRRKIVRKLFAGFFSRLHFAARRRSLRQRRRPFYRYQISTYHVPPARVSTKTIPFGPGLLECDNVLCNTICTARFRPSFRTPPTSSLSK